MAGYRSQLRVMVFTLVFMGILFFGRGMQLPRTYIHVYICVHTHAQTLGNLCMLFNILNHR